MHTGSSSNTETDTLQRRVDVTDEPDKQKAEFRQMLHDAIEGYRSVLEELAEL